MNEYRLTRSSLYKNINCPGATDVTARNGHYIVAENEAMARKEMCKRFPEDYGDFTCDLWHENVFVPVYTKNVGKEKR